MCMNMYAQAPLYMWRSEDSVQESALFSSHVGLEDPTLRVFRFGVRASGVLPH